jgi:hypothetical protein
LNQEPVRELEIQGVLCLEFLDLLADQLNKVATPVPRRADLRRAYNERWRAEFWIPLPPPLSPFAHENKLLDSANYKPLVGLQVSQKNDSWAALRDRIRAATRERGDRVKLAREFGVTPQAVAKWLSGASAPTAETTLRLLDFVTAKEAKPKTSAGLLEAGPARKNQTKKSPFSEKQSSARKKN